MSAGKKRDKIKIYSLEKQQAESGYENEDYTLKYNLKAETSFSSNSIVTENSEIIQQDKVSFRIYKRNIEYTDKVFYNNNRYNIISINPITYTNEIVLICEKDNL